MEQINLPEPIKADPGSDTFTVARLDFELSPEPKIKILLNGNNGHKISHSYEGITALNLLRYVNTANFSTNSLHKQLMNRLITDGVISGTITGVPDS